MSRFLKFWLVSFIGLGMVNIAMYRITDDWAARLLMNFGLVFFIMDRERVE